MTIVEALKIVMNGNTQGMTSKEAYEKIIEQNLYSFPAKDPCCSCKFNDTQTLFGY